MQTWQKWQTDSVVRKTYLIREEIIKSIRNFFYEKGFHEVETPLLVKSLIPESYLEYFKTTLLDRKHKPTAMYLTASPEASLKKLLTAGFGNCFEITRSFRNTETDSKTHNPEFSMLEWYRVNADYRQSMKDIKNLYLAVFRNLTAKKLITAHNGIIDYQKKHLNIKNWQEISVVESLKKFSGINFDDITDNKGLNDDQVFAKNKIARIARKKGYQIDPENTWEEIFNQIFLNEVEPHLGLINPVIIYDFPKPMSALAKLRKDDKRLAERFELYIGGLELADCYTELTDWKEQIQRFSVEMKTRRQKKKMKIIPDGDFLKALQVGLPSASGVALGLDRTVMLFANVADINLTRLFPTV